MNSVTTTSPSKREIETCLLLADRVVEMQGVLFIKEFLREAARKDNDIRIGVSKRDVVKNIKDAITQGRIPLDRLQHWVDGVEGWGRQHVYLYHVSDTLAKAPWLKQQQALEAKLSAARMKKYLNKRDKLDFSEKLELGHIGLDQDGFHCVWRQGITRRKRDDIRDLKRNIDGDPYEFDAYRIQPMRAVMRFELRPRDQLAALLLQRPLSQHKDAKTRAKAILSKFFSEAELSDAKIGNAIRVLDQEDLDNKNAPFKSQQAKFKRQGASIEFVADPGLATWKDVEKVRDVRKALDTPAFSGENARFKVQLSGSGAMQRDIILSLSAQDHRMYFFAQMTADEVWKTLKAISAHTK